MVKSLARVYMGDCARQGVLCGGGGAVQGRAAAQGVSRHGMLEVMAKAGWLGYSGVEGGVVGSLRLDRGGGVMALRG